jgi:DnaJ-class molecular chaperone
LTQGEKIRIETILGKKYEAEINSPKHLNNLKFTLKSEGIIDENKQLGDYLIKFDIIAPNLSKLNKAQRKQFLSILEET